LERIIVDIILEGVAMVNILLEGVASARPKLLLLMDEVDSFRFLEGGHSCPPAFGVVYGDSGRQECPPSKNNL
jgi:hypothetical protein